MPRQGSSRRVSRTGCRVYYAGWLSGQWDSSNSSVVFSLRTLNADDATPADWSSLLAAAQPQKITGAAWSTISSNLQAQLGTTAGGYVRLLDSEGVIPRPIGRERH